MQVKTTIDQFSMPKYRILHIIDSLGTGGSEHQLLLNLSALDKNRFENLVCYLRPSEDLLAPMSRLGAHVFCLGVRGKAQWPGSIYRLFRFIKSHRIDLVHTCLFEADLLGGAVGRLAGVPVVSTLANSCYEPVWLTDNVHLNRFKLAGMRSVRALLARMANCHLVAVSQYVKQSAVAQLGVRESKITVIYRALAPSWRHQGDDAGVTTLKNRLGINGDWPILVNVGRLVPQKGQRYLIEAMPRILHHYPQARLLIAGDGLLGPALTRLRGDLGLDDQVQFLGHRDDVGHLLLLGDAFVFSSLYEGCPNSLIEAMAAGK
ncbi:MAG: glycosyltransferase, partial [Dehalococcoidia bacterium]